MSGLSLCSNICLRLAVSTITMSLCLPQTDGTTPLVKAVLGWHDSTVQLLIDRGADLAAVDDVSLPTSSSMHTLLHTTC
jgi:hypothetical protein